MPAFDSCGHLRRCLPTYQLQDTCTTGPQGHSGTICMPLDLGLSVFHNAASDLFHQPPPTSTSATSASSLRCFPPIRSAMTSAQLGSLPSSIPLAHPPPPTSSAYLPPRPPLPTSAHLPTHLAHLTSSTHFHPFHLTSAFHLRLHPDHVGPTSPSVADGAWCRWMCDCVAHSEQRPGDFLRGPLVERARVRVSPAEGHPSACCRTFFTMGYRTQAEQASLIAREPQFGAALRGAGSALVLPSGH